MTTDKTIVWIIYNIVIMFSHIWTALNKYLRMFDRAMFAGSVLGVDVLITAYGSRG